jgi:hypothetical protein
MNVEMSPDGFQEGNLRWISLPNHDGKDSCSWNIGEEVEEAFSEV